MYIDLSMHYLNPNPAFGFLFKIIDKINLRYRIRCEVSHSMSNYSLIPLIMKILFTFRH